MVWLATASSKLRESRMKTAIVRMKRVGAIGSSTSCRPLCSFMKGMHGEPRKTLAEDSKDYDFQVLVVNQVTPKNTRVRGWSYQTHCS